MDPVNGQKNDPSTFLSKYIYAANNPGLFVDPSGESFLTPILLGAVTGVILNWAFKGEFSVFQAALIGASAGYFAAEALYGVGLYSFEGLSIIERLLSEALIGGAAGGIAGMLTSITLGLVTQNPVFYENFEQAMLLGIGAGAVVGIGMGEFGNLLDKQVYGRLKLLSDPLSYASAYPSDVVMVTTTFASVFICHGKNISSPGETSCAF